MEINQKVLPRTLQRRRLPRNDLKRLRGGDVVRWTSIRTDERSVEMHWKHRSTFRTGMLTRKRT